MSRIKKISIILMFILMPINTFSALVSDSDGPSFVTKVEFENLKDNVHQEIEKYENKIDDRIDGAIESYLNGLSLTDPVTDYIIFSNWEDVTCMNGAIKPEFELPDFTGNFSWYLNYDGASTASTKNFYDIKFIYGSWAGKLKNDWNKTKRIRRALVTGNDESGDQTLGLIWNGIAKRYEEKYTITRTYYKNNVNLQYLNRLDSYSTQLNLYNLTNLLMDTYLPNFAKEKEKIVNPTFGWGWGSKGSTSYPPSHESVISYNSGDVQIFTNTASITLGEDENGKTKEYEHIVQWDKNTEWAVSNENFIKTFRKYTGNTNCTSEKLLQNCTIGGLYDTFGVDIQNSPGYINKTVDPTSGVGYMNLQNGLIATARNKATGTTAILPSIGMLKNDQKASNIKQHDNAKTVMFHNKRFDVVRPTLEQGFQFIAAEEGTTIIWFPKIKEVYYYDGTNYVTDNTKEIMMKFSVGPFDDKNDTSNVIKFESGGTEVDTLKYEDGERVYFIMPSDGVVYMKWWPNISDEYLNNYDWHVTLDIANSKEYTYQYKIEY